MKFKIGRFGFRIGARNHVGVMDTADIGRWVGHSGFWWQVRKPASSATLLRLPVLPKCVGESDLDWKEWEGMKCNFEFVDSKTTNDTYCVTCGERKNIRGEIVVTGAIQWRKEFYAASRK